MKSPNFQFLAEEDSHLFRLATQAERFCLTMPDIALTRLRQLIEAIAVSATQQSRGYEERDSLIEMIREMEDNGMLSRDMARAFHLIRMEGNEAAHEAQGTQSEALHMLKLARAITIWFHRLTNPRYRPGAFVPPPEPVDANAELRAQLAAARKKLAAERAAHEKTRDLAEALEEDVEEAESAAREAWEELEVAMDLAEETEDRLLEAQEQFLSRQAGATNPDFTTGSAAAQKGKQAADLFLGDLDEEARAVIQR